VKQGVSDYWKRQALLSICHLFTPLRNYVFVGYVIQTDLRALYVVKCDRLQTCAKIEQEMHQRGQGWWWSSWSRHCATRREVAASISDDVIGNFHWHNPSGPHCDPGVDSAFNRNAYQEHFLGTKKVGACGWQTYNIFVPIVTKSISLGMLEPSGPIKGLLQR